MDALSNEARNRMEVMDCFRLENRFVNEILALSSSVRPSFGNGRENSYQAKLCVTSEERCRRNLAVNRVNVFCRASLESYNHQDRVVEFEKKMRGSPRRNKL